MKQPRPKTIKNTNTSHPNNSYIYYLYLVINKGRTLLYNANDQMIVLQNRDLVSFAKKIFPPRPR